MSWVMDLIRGQAEMSRKIDEMDKRLTKQMACQHRSVSYTYTSLLNICSWQKKCRDCGLDMGTVSTETKNKEQLEDARKEVARLEADILQKDVRQ